MALALEAGVIAPDEIIRWADSILATTYDDAVANISMSSDLAPKELTSLLLQYSRDEDPCAAMTRVLWRIHDAIIRNRSRVMEFARFFERFTLRQRHVLSDDLHFFIGVVDAFELAKAGRWGSVEEATERLLDDLAGFPRALQSREADR